MLLDIDVGAQVLKCKGQINTDDDSKTIRIIRNVINVSTISICLFSLAMCLRAIYRAQILRKVSK